MNSNLPLSGIRVVEFTHIVMGPACGLVLADLGAEVIKVEPTPDGDRTRRLVGTGAGMWACFNRNKKSFAADLKSSEGLAAVKKLLATADVVVENFRPGAMEKLGLGYEDVKRLRADLVYCSLKGFLSGPNEERPALDEVVQMNGGLAYMTGPQGRPLRAGASVNDIMGGMFGAIAILAALRERTRTGCGQHVRSALFENNLFLVGQHMLQYAVTGVAPSPMPNRTSAWAIYDVFDTADGDKVFIAVVSDAQWRSFCDAFGLSALAADTELATNNQRVLARERLFPLVAGELRARTRAEVVALCERARLPHGLIRKPWELFEDPHVRASDGLTDVTLADGRKVGTPKLPFEMGGRRFGARLDLPAAGGHTLALLAELGYEGGEAHRLMESGAVSGPSSVEAGKTDYNGPVHAYPRHASLHAPDGNRELDHLAATRDQ